MFSDDDISCLGDRIAARAAAIDAGLHPFFTDLRHFDRSRGWAKFGQTSCAHWLSLRCGIALGSGREKVRVAHALADLPKTDEALREGILSYSKVRSVTRIATPETEEKLIEMARINSAAAVERLCRVSAQQTPSEKEPTRWFRVRDTPAGMVRVGMLLRPEEASRLVQAIEAAAKDRVEGILAIADGYLRGNLPDQPPTTIVVHVEAAALTGVQGDVGVPPETCRRLLCDADIVPVFEDNAGNPVEVGPKKATFSPAFRHALGARDGGCRFPGCTRRKHLHAHTIRHWIDGGEITMANTVLLCGTHEKLVHEGGYRIVAAGGEVRFFSPVGIELVASGVAGSGSGVTSLASLPATQSVELELSAEDALG